MNKKLLVFAFSALLAIGVVGDDAYCILADGAGLGPDDINSLINAIR